MPSNAEKYTEMAIDLTVPLALARSFSERVAARKAIADALEAVERDTAETCERLATREMGNHAEMVRVVAAIRAEFGIAEKENG